MAENKTSVKSKTTEMIIGKNKYIVTSHYKANGRETAEQKLLQYVSNRVAGDIKSPNNAVI